MAASRRAHDASSCARHTEFRPERRDLHVAARRRTQSEDPGHTSAMARLTIRLRVPLTTVVLVIHAALVPLLYLGVSAIVEDGYAEQFVTPIRSYSRLVADELAADDAQAFDPPA